MAEELKQPMYVTIREAALIRYIRDSSPFTNITLTKVDNRIERIRNEELRTVKDLMKQYGLIAEDKPVAPLDNSSEDAIVE